MASVTNKTAGLPGGGRGARPEKGAGAAPSDCAGLSRRFVEPLPPVSFQWLKALCISCCMS